jgi:hypothetical protein
LAGLSIASLIVGMLILVFWWRSFSHTDHYSIGSLNSTQTTYTSRDGRILVTTSENVGGGIMSRSQPYTYKQVVGWSLVIPAMWLAVMVRRRWLPRPGIDPVLKGKGSR